MSGQIVAKENDLKVISKIVEYLVEEHGMERSRTLLEIKDASGRAFRYISMKDGPNQNNRKRECRRMDEIFHQLVDHSSEEGTPRTRRHAFLENDEDSLEEDAEEDSSQEDKAHIALR